MAYYAYKSVCHRADFIASVPLYKEQLQTTYDGDAGYDGDAWYVASFLLDQKDAQLATAKAELAEAYRALVCLVDCDLHDPKWDDHCRVLEKARAFVEGEEK